LRAVFPNPDRVLFPGVFARLRIPTDTIRALLVPEEALATDQAGKYVLIVNEQNAVEARRVEVGGSQDGLTVIASGLAAGEWIVTTGLQRARPGSTVNPERKLLQAKSTAQSRDSATTARP
jgi:RND family efflux transporter MFP subunit